MTRDNMVILDKFLETAVEMGADMLEFEYDGGDLRVVAFRGPMGLGIGSVESNSEQSTQLIGEIEALRRRKTVNVGDVACRISVSRYDSFGECAWRIKLARAKATKK